MKSTVVLTMMMRDEFPVLQRCLRSYKPHIDAWCIMDTGSTDQSATLAQLMLEDVPGTLFESAWVNFGHNRAELIRRAAEFGDYLLLSDADNALAVTGERPEEFTMDMYGVYTRGDQCWTPRLIRAGYPWVYVGSTHEYLATVSPHPVKRTKCTWWELEHFGDGARRPRKAAEDETLLREELKREPDNARACFYLASVLRDQGKYKEALMMFKRRVELGGWRAEVDLSVQQIERFLRGDFRTVGVPGQ